MKFDLKAYEAEIRTLLQDKPQQPNVLQSLVKRAKEKKSKATPTGKVA